MGIFRVRCVSASFGTGDHVMGTLKKLRVRMEGRVVG